MATQGEAHRTPGVLWVTDEVPDVDGTGGAVRQYHLLRAVAARHPVDLLVAGRDVPAEVAGWVRSCQRVAPVPPAGPEPWLRTATVSLLDPAPEDVRGGRPNRRRLHPALAARAPTDVVVVQHAWLAELVRHRRGGERWLLDLHNVPSAKTRHGFGTARTRRGRAWLRVEVVKARRTERRALGRFEQVVVPSVEDARALGDDPGVHVVGNGVDLRRYRPSALPDAPRVVFTGHLGYPPNVDAVTWFAREVWPRVRAARSAAHLDVVGFAPTDEVAALDGRAGIRVHADVASTVPFLQGARVAVVPVRIGSGTRLKALEAMASQRPVVGTTIGLEGLDVEDGEHVLVRDDAPSMAAAILALCADGAQADGVARRGRALVGERFAWPRLAERFADLVGARAGTGRRAGSP